MRSFLLVTICQLFLLPLALAKTGDAPGPHSTASNSTFAPAGQMTDGVPPPVVHDANQSDHFEWLQIQGFWVQVRLPQGMDVNKSEHYTETINLLNRQLERVKGVLPKPAIAKLQSGVFIYIVDNCTHGGYVNYYRFDDVPDQGWIGLHCFQYLRNILADAYHGGETVHGSPVWGNSGLILHEMAHAWHDLIVDDGWENRMIKEFYQHARHCIGNTNKNDPYYWETDEAEFFADFTVMYYLSHWDSPGEVWNMQFKYRRLIISLWKEFVYQNWESTLASC